MKNPFIKLYNAVEGHVLKNADLRTLKVVSASKGDTSKASNNLEREAQSMQAQTLNEWKMAISQATDPEEPDKSMLAKLYANLRLDNHLSSVIDSRILFCQRSPFKIVNEAGDENKYLSWLFERTWFEEFISLTLESRFQGPTVIELYDINPDTKELDGIDEIPMEFVNTKKGIIMKTPGNQTGWNYKEGVLQPYYIQVGKDKDLGLLAQIAPIVLAKKLGLGSWLDYIEKYGVPSLFITTDREDDARLNQLYEAASNFKSNGFMVGRGNEKFEVKTGDGGNPDNFDKLIERANTEMSKRILGGSGLTDEKSFVGAAEIQFRLAKDRFESDKLLVKNIINQQLFPRLKKISPVYAVLEGHYFEWDNTESQSSKEVAELVNILGNLFELDPEEIGQKTGLKILAQKANPYTPATPPTEEDKKKSELKK